MLSPRLGRWLSLDAYASRYPNLSDYSFVANSPLMYIDPDGNKIIGVSYNPKTGQYSYTKSALKNGTKRYVEARMQTKLGRESIHKIHSDSREVDIIVTDKMIVRKGKDGSYTVSGGSTLSFEAANYVGDETASIYISLNEYGTNDASEGKAGEDIEAVYIKDGVLNDITLNSNDFLSSKGKMTKFDRIHNRENKRAGVDSFNDKWGQNKEQELHNTGAHEEAHLFEKGKIGLKKSERAAYTAEAVASKDFLAPKRFENKSAKKL